MTTDKLYCVKKRDFPKLEKLLTDCFLDDPLYKTLIPDEKIRKRIMPLLFKCDLVEFYHTCEIYADSPELNGLIIVSDEDAPYNVFRYFFDEVMAELKTDGFLLMEDPSFNLLRKFTKSRDYFNSSWTKELHCEKRLHIIYYAVSPTMRHCGISVKLIDPVIEYADRHGYMISLETHNPANVSIYKHFGYEVFKEIEEVPGLRQYCLIRRSPNAPCDTVSPAKGNHTTTR